MVNPYRHWYEEWSGRFANYSGPYRIKIYNPELKELEIHTCSLPCAIAFLETYSSILIIGMQLLIIWFLIVEKANMLSNTVSRQILKLRFWVSQKWNNFKNSHFNLNLDMDNVSPWELINEYKREWRRTYGKDIEKCYWNVHGKVFVVEEKRNVTNFTVSEFKSAIQFFKNQDSYWGKDLRAYIQDPKKETVKIRIPDKYMPPPPVEPKNRHLMLKC